MRATREVVGGGEASLSSSVELSKSSTLAYFCLLLRLRWPRAACVTGAGAPPTLTACVLLFSEEPCITPTIMPEEFKEVRIYVGGGGGHGEWRLSPAMMTAT